MRIHHVDRILKILLVALAFCAASVGAAQQAPVKSPLLDRLVGKWVLQGTIAGKATIHDVDAEWVLNHHYVRIHEVSREKNAKGQPQYEATIYVAWNEPTKQYAAIWLDVYGGMSSESIGVADPKENDLPFIFKDDEGAVSFSNDFVYDVTVDAWEWRMDNVVNGAAKPFGRVKLKRSLAAGGKTGQRAGSDAALRQSGAGYVPANHFDLSSASLRKILRHVA